MRHHHIFHKNGLAPPLRETFQARRLKQRLVLSQLVINSLHLKMIILPETNTLHLKMDGWKIDFLLG